MSRSFTIQNTEHEASERDLVVIAHVVLVEGDDDKPLVEIVKPGRTLDLTIEKGGVVGISDRVPEWVKREEMLDAANATPAGATPERDTRRQEWLAAGEALNFPVGELALLPSVAGSIAAPDPTPVLVDPDGTAPAPDPLDHDGDGRKGGRRPRAQTKRAAK